VSREREVGLTLVETVAAIAVMAVAVAVGVGSIASSLPESTRAPLTVTANELARDLLEEILARSFDDPNGTESGEAGRSSWDDIFDYNGFTESPPTDPTGAAITGATGYTRTVRVIPVATTDPGGAAVARAGATLARVEVDVTWGGGSKITLAGLKAEPSPGVLPAPRSGFYYVPGSRGSSGNEQLIVSLVNQTGKAITIDSAQLLWFPADTFYYTQIQINSIDEADSANGTTFARGQTVSLTPPFTFQPGVSTSWGDWHLRANPDGTGSAMHPSSYSFSLILFSGSTSYQLDIPVGG
jgi:type II secretory pathway pseudopilin PulG